MDLKPGILVSQPGIEPVHSATGKSHELLMKAIILTKN